MLLPKRPGGLVKYPGNPILSPVGDTWQSLSVFNPATWTDGERIYMLYRAEGPGLFPGRAFTSCIGLAISTDGIHFEREPEPVLTATEPYEIPGGCEDPRVVQIDGTFHLTYTAFDGSVARLAHAVSQDLRFWTKLGLMFTDEQWDAYFPATELPDVPRGWSKSGAILAQPINNIYVMFFGDTNLWLARSCDLVRWDIHPEPVLRPRQGSFDSRLVEPGPPPRMTSAGVWLGYNSADERLRYAFGQALFSSSDPTHLLDRGPEPLLEPSTAEELVGQVNQVVFVEGLSELQDTIFLYYGMADRHIGLATARASDQIE